MTTSIGVLGGGQLARMLCEAASPLAIPVHVLDQADCPASQCIPASHHVLGSFKDPACIRALARRVDVLTVEIEHVDVAVLEEIATVGVDIGENTKKVVPVHPSWRTLRLVQNKFDQKEHFANHAIPVAEQHDLGTVTGLETVAERFGYPFMVKAKRDSYDGRGNYRVNGPGDFGRAIASLGGDLSGLYAEKWVPFVAELSVMVIRTEDANGVLKGTYAYPPVETVHEDSICSLVFMPPRTTTTPVLLEQARRLAEKTVSTLWGRGVFAVEMFVTGDNTLLVNEVAPRPHNSGHHTIEALPQLSQFKAQLYSILDMIPHGVVAGALLTPRFCQALMVNILGGAGPDSHAPLVNLARAHSAEFAAKGLDAHLHMYGKEARPNRKIGHITITSQSEEVSIVKAAEAFIQSAAQIRQERLTSPPPPVPAVVSPRPPLVVVTMGSDSDMPVLKAGLDILTKFDVPFEVRITSAHRTPHLMTKLGREAAERGVRVLIAAAGGAAHLPGMLASETPLPVIGVPVRASQLDGMDSLLSIVQMPRGIPTATVGINNSTNAALLAIRILAAHDPAYLAKMDAYMADMAAEVEAKADVLGRVGYVEYLATRLK